VTGPNRATRAGIPPAAFEATLTILRGSPGPMKRRALLDILERKGHRISLAGLNRILEQAKAEQRVRERVRRIVGLGRRSLVTLDQELSVLVGRGLHMGLGHVNDRDLAER
jgi:hypothetical protein